MGCNTEVGSLVFCHETHSHADSPPISGPIDLRCLHTVIDGHDESWLGLPAADGFDLFTLSRPSPNDRLSGRRLALQLDVFK